MFDMTWWRIVGASDRVLRQAATERAHVAGGWLVSAVISFTGAVHGLSWQIYMDYTNEHPLLDDTRLGGSLAVHDSAPPNGLLLLLLLVPTSKLCCC